MQNKTAFLFLFGVSFVDTLFSSHAILRSLK